MNNLLSNTYFYKGSEVTNEISNYLIDLYNTTNLILINTEIKKISSLNEKSKKLRILFKFKRKKQKNKINGTFL